MNTPDTSAPLARRAGSANSAWPARDIVQGLVDAADILFGDIDYEHGWERLHEARTHARAWLDTRLSAPRSAGFGKTHELKTDPDVFQAVLDGRKTYEIRKNDRGFTVGDVLLLRETEHSGAAMAGGAPLVYTGRREARAVTHILTGPIYGLAASWSILSLGPRLDFPNAQRERLAGNEERINAERVAFERWIASRGQSTERLGDSYADRCVAEQWDAWVQATMGWMR